jgi:hypothetical protein
MPRRMPGEAGTLLCRRALVRSPASRRRASGFLTDLHGAVPGLPGPSGPVAGAFLPITRAAVGVVTGTGLANHSGGTAQDSHLLPRSRSRNEL